MADDWKEQLPTWANSREQKFKWGKAKGYGADKGCFNDEDVCDGFLSSKEPQQGMRLKEQIQFYQNSCK